MVAKLQQGKMNLSSLSQVLAHAGLVLGLFACASASDDGAALGGAPSPGGSTAPGRGCAIPECFRAVQCVVECGGEVLQSGCCPCPAGTFDSIVCGTGDGPADQ